MALNEKLTAWRKLGGLRQNQISTANLIHKTYKCIKINTLGNFEIEAPTHMSATHAISKPDHKGRIPVQAVIFF